jgi:hypothetical protein
LRQRKADPSNLGFTFMQEATMSLHDTASLPDTFRRIRLELAREPGRPMGDSGIGYALVAPIDEEGRLDADEAQRHRRACKVVRFRAGEESDVGYLRRRPGGSWAFHYDFEDGGEDDDPGYRLGDHRFVIGEYVTIFEDEGAHTYRIAAVERV